MFRNNKGKNKIFALRLAQELAVRSQVGSKITVISGVALLVPCLREIIAIVDDQRRHILVVREIREKLGRDEEVLATVLRTGYLNQLVMHRALVFYVHAL